MAKLKTKKTHRILDARPDTLDFRDQMYVPTLVEVPPRINLSEYKKCRIPILNQGTEGACTGFGLATVAHYLLRCRRVLPDQTLISPRMLYEMAKRYDEWRGENYDGSSARGAMKGWHKHGVCDERLWPYQVRPDNNYLSDKRAMDAVRRPLGAYYRVNHKDLVSMHSAIAEVGILYATAMVHAGWDKVGADGKIPYPEPLEGGHAFAIVAYDERGFWIQNSWGTKWGKQGFALITYDDWLANGTDVWVARLGAPVVLRNLESVAVSHSAAAGKSEANSYKELRPHIINIGNNGLLNTSGTYGTSPQEVEAIFKNDFPRITRGWKKKRILLYAHGGLVDESIAVQRLADYRPTLLEHEIYPISFIWHSDFWSTITNILQDALRRRRSEGFLDASKDFMLDRLDDALEPIARALTGKALWDEMKENALAATINSNGGARIALEQLNGLLKTDPRIELSVAGHSAGSIFHAPLIRLLTSAGKIADNYLAGETGLNRQVASCVLWAPACTVELFKETYLPAIQNGSIGRFALFTLTDQAEQDDHCANIYHKSLLYLVSNAFEKKPHIPLFRDGVEILGMEKFVLKDRDLIRLFNGKKADWIRSPNAEVNSPNSSTSRHHGDFDDDQPTLQATLMRILGTAAKGEFTIHRSAASLSARRRQLV